MEKKVEDIKKELKSILKKEKMKESLCSPEPEPFIDSEKEAILFIGLNPSGDESDANRDKKTKGLFLNYYKELEKWEDNNINDECSGRLIYKPYFSPILDFFEKATDNKKTFAWEWCNYKDFEKLVERIKLVHKITEEEKKSLKECWEYYRNSNYQIIVRDLFYYHISSEFKTLLKSEKDVNDKIKTIVKERLDRYIDLFQRNNLKLIYISFTIACDYVELAIEKELTNSCYRGIPVVFAGRSLSGVGAMDKYSKERLIREVREVLSR